ncbi:MAG TPA: sugar O-acetyltransferase [Firmicutes bacterium]|nr:sugar O-acetyltransferase [Bacillota bacterium]
MTERERMIAGKLYNPADAEIMQEQTGCAHFLKEYNALGQGDEARMKELMQQMFAEVGEGCYIQPPFYANWSGKHVHLGRNVYANFNLTLVDDADIYIGDMTMIAPNVTITTATHPILPSLREKALQYNVDVHIGKNVWIGAGVIILPGVTIGDNSGIGAGSVVTKDIPANVVAVGVPCRVMRPIGERDEIYYYKDNKIDL